MSAPNRSTVADALAADRLGTPSIIAFAMTAAAPFTAIGGVVTAGWASVSATTGITAYPLAFVLIAVVLALFSVGYLAMSRRINNTGAFYSYIAHGAGKPTGVAAAFVALIAYNLLQISLYGLFGYATATLIQTKTGLDIQWWVYALASWAIVAVLGVLRVDLNAKILMTIVAGEVAVVVVFDTVFLANPASDGLSLSTLAPDNLFQPGIGAVLVAIFTTFIGFEAAAVYSEESRDRTRTVPTATYLALTVIVIFYAVTSWAIAVTVGDDKLIPTAQQYQSDMMFSVAAERMGITLIADFGIILLITSVFAAMLSYHNTVARYTFALAREHVLPKALARTGLYSAAPKNASLLQSIVGVAVIAISAIIGWDPFFQLFFWLGMAGGFGVLILVTATAISVVMYFTKNGGTGKPLQHLIAPGTAAVILSVIVYFAFDSFDALLSLEPTDPWWIVPVMYVAAAAIGVAWAMILKSTKPTVYTRIGVGATLPQSPTATTGDRA